VFVLCSVLVIVTLAYLDIVHAFKITLGPINILIVNYVDVGLRFSSMFSYFDVKINLFMVIVFTSRQVIKLSI